MSKHKIPEQQFFNDPSIDRIFGVVMALATEVYVLHDRQKAIEERLATQGIIDIEALNAEPTDDDRLKSKIDREAFVAHLMDNLIGDQVSLGIV